MAKTKSKTKSKKAKPKLSTEERRLKKLQSDHMRSVRAGFRNSGFDRLPELAGKEVSFGGQAGEFDDAFRYENVLVLIEYTAKQSSDVTSHLKAKKILFRKITDSPTSFLEYLRSTFPKFNAAFGANYHEDRYLIRIVYCSRNSYDEAIRTVVDEPVYMDFPVVKYFEKIAGIIKLSAQAELLDFMNIDPAEVGEAGKFPKKGAMEPYPGSILPDEASGYPKGYKVVSFYADAATLLQRAFVLRRSGWRGSFEAYQRMLIPKKVEEIRSLLRSKQQVAINNIIATLPSDVSPVQDGKTVDIYRSLPGQNPLRSRCLSAPTQLA